MDKHKKVDIKTQESLHTLKNFFVVYLNNYDVGAIYDKEQIELLITDQIEAVYAKHDSKREFNGRDFEDKHFIKLFVKLRENEDGECEEN